MEFVFWKHSTPVGIMVEEVSEGDDFKGNVWKDLALQIISEHGKNDYREFLHLNNGVPILKGYDGRISISHTAGLYLLAYLPPTPESDLTEFSQRTAMGIDCERLDREQVLKVRDKFLSDDEKNIIKEDDLTANIQAWTAKEALLKASLNPAIDYKNDIKLLSLPPIDENPAIGKDEELKLGEAILTLREYDKTQDVPMALYSYESEGHCVTLAFSPKCARFKSSLKPKK